MGRFACIVWIQYNSPTMTDNDLYMRLAVIKIIINNLSKRRIKRYPQQVDLYPDINYISHCLLKGMVEFRFLLI